MAVEAIDRHPEADLAVLRVDRDAAQGVEPFWRALPARFGEPFIAFGYPENVFGEDSGQPTARLFRGHYQRFFENHSRMGYRYEAGEMSIPSPRGLSGGPLFRVGAPMYALGLAAENFQSTTGLEVISYGVAVMLAPLEGWLDERLPEFDTKAYHARQRADRERAAAEGGVVGSVGMALKGDDDSSPWARNRVTTE